MITREQKRLRWKGEGDRKIKPAVNQETDINMRRKKKRATGIDLDREKGRGRGCIDRYEIQEYLLVAIDIVVVRFKACL